MDWHRSQLLSSALDASKAALAARLFTQLSLIDSLNRSIINKYNVVNFLKKIVSY